MRDPSPAEVEHMQDALGDRRWLVLTGAGVSTEWSPYPQCFSLPHIPVKFEFGHNC